MKSDYDINLGQRLLRVRFRGSVDLESFHELAAAVQGDPLFSDEYVRLIDARGMVVDDALSAPVMSEIASAVSAHHTSPRKRAFVAGSDVLFGMLRMLELMCNLEGQHMRVFRSVEEAEAWLGVRPEGRASG